tara:strand:- start:297 stop:740 length:444 start_codon:yes stop_codon:yes gene_type:complete
MSGFWDIEEGQSLDELEDLYESASILDKMKEDWKKMEIYDAALTLAMMKAWRETVEPEDREANRIRVYKQFLAIYRYRHKKQAWGAPLMKIRRYTYEIEKQIFFEASSKDQYMKQFLLRNLAKECIETYEKKRSAAGKAGGASSFRF